MKRVVKEFYPKDTITLNQIDIARDFVVTKRGEHYNLVVDHNYETELYSERCLQEHFTMGNCCGEKISLESIFKRCDEMYVFENLNELGEFLSKISNRNE